MNAVAQKAKRIVRSFKEDVTRRYVTQETELHKYDPEVRHGGFYTIGLESKIMLGKVDLQKLGYPTRIKVVIYNLD